MSKPKRQDTIVFLVFSKISYFHRSSTEIWGLWSIREKWCAWLEILWNLFNFQNKPHRKFEESYWIETFSGCIFLSMSWMQNCTQHEQSLFGAQKQNSYVAFVIVSIFKAIKFWNQIICTSQARLLGICPQN